MHPLSEPALTRPLAVLASKRLSVRPAAVDTAGVDTTGAASIQKYGLSVCPGIRFTPADRWECDRELNAVAIGETVNHQLSLDPETGIVWAVPTRPHLTKTLFVNSTLVKFVDFIWRWASLDSVLDELSHDIDSFDVTDDFLAFVHENDPAASGAESLWVSWVDTN